MKHLQQNNTCPCCRGVLIEYPEEEDDEDDEDDSEAEEDDEDADEYEESYPIEQLVSTFEAKGYGLKDALSLLMYKFSKTDPLYTKQYIRKLEDDIDEMNEDLMNAIEERETMEEEDANVSA